MTLQQAEEIKQVFLSMAPESHYYIHPNFKASNGIVKYSASLFTGPENSAMKIAVLSLSTLIGSHSNDIVIAELFIGDNSYRFLHNPELCKEIIERFVPIKKVELDNSKIQPQLLS